MGGGHDRIRIDAEMVIKVRDRPCLAKMLNAKRGGFMTGDGAEPGQGCGMTVGYGDEGGMGWQVLEQSFYMAAGPRLPAAAGALGGGPAGV